MHSSSRDGAKTRLLALHTTEGIMSAKDLRAWKAWPGSSHAAADATGVLLSGAEDGFVDYKRASWTLRGGNPVSENLEMCAMASWTRAQWLARPKLLDRAAYWLATRHRATGVPLVKLSPADVKAGKSGVIGHVDWTRGMADGTHWDPGPHFPWDVVLAAARAYAAPSTAPPQPPFPIGDAMHVACKFPNGKIVYATLSGGILTGLQDASAESTKTAEKNGRLFVQWLTVDDWNEHVRHSNLLLGETPLKPAPAA